MNFIFNDNVPERILCLSCNVKKVGKLVRFKQKGQKQVSFLAFHECCQRCLLRGPRFISTSFILVCALRCTWLQGTRKVYSSSTNKAKNYSYSIFVVLVVNYIYYEFSLLHICSLVLQPWMSAYIRKTDGVYISVPKND